MLPTSLPDGFVKARLFEEGDNRWRWHLRNEAGKAALFSANIGVGLLAAYFIKAPWLRAGVGLSIDYLNAGDWTDFIWRQGVRAPLTVDAFTIQKGSRNRQWLLPLTY
ncbi:hypothetical protein, partial [Sansalvadorimonas verongulae]|uniref:hypothetical protein n=1 Tax=Sansalvadorimonas verongulae TaxID=2172824 RepID=UPI0012BC981C